MILVYVTIAILVFLFSAILFYASLKGKNIKGKIVSFVFMVGCVSFILGAFILPQDDASEQANIGVNNEYKDSTEYSDTPPTKLQATDVSPLNHVNTQTSDNDEDPFAEGVFHLNYVDDDYVIHTEGLNTTSLALDYDTKTLNINGSSYATNILFDVLNVIREDKPKLSFYRAEVGNALEIGNAMFVVLNYSNPALYDHDQNRLVLLDITGVWEQAKEWSGKLLSFDIKENALKFAKCPELSDDIIPVLQGTILNSTCETQEDIEDSSGQVSDEKNR